jgi:hypothetical protein
MRRLGWDRVLTSDGYGPLLFYLILGVTSIFAGFFFLRLMTTLHTLALPLR